MEPCSVAEDNDWESYALAVAEGNLPAIAVAEMLEDYLLGVFGIHDDLFAVGRLSCLRGSERARNNQRQKGGK